MNEQTPIARLQVMDQGDRLMTEIGAPGCRIRLVASQRPRGHADSDHVVTRVVARRQPRDTWTRRDIRWGGS